MPSPIEDSTLSVVARQALEHQPFSRLLGTTLENIEPGHAEIHLPVTSELLQQHGYVHGGVIAYLADNAMAFAAGSVLGDAVTLEFKINYLRPAKGASSLTALAQVEACGRRTAVVRCEISAEIANDWRRIALAQGTIQAPEGERS